MPAPADLDLPTLRWVADYLEQAAETEERAAAKEPGELGRVWQARAAGQRSAMRGLRQRAGRLERQRGAQ